MIQTRPPLPDLLRYALLLALIGMGAPFVFAQAAVADANGASTGTSTATLSLAQQLPPELRGVKVVEHLGRQIKLDYTFTNESGQPVALRDFFHKDRPVILQLVYYSCPMLCSLVLNGYTDAAKQLDWNPAENYEVVTISIKPDEQFNLAAVKKTNYLNEYGRPHTANGWHWLTSTDNQVKALAEEIGFHYKFDEKSGEYLHEAAIFVLTSEGTISRYLYGIKYEPRDLRLALLEAGQGKIGTTLDRIMLFCFHYDPAGKKYGLVAMRVMQVGGAITVTFIAAVIGFYFWTERRMRRKQAAAGDDPQAGAAPPAPPASSAA